MYKQVGKLSLEEEINNTKDRCCYGKVRGILF